MTDAEAEEYLLGYLIKHPSQFDAIVNADLLEEPIGGLDFQSKYHRQLFAVIRANHHRGGDYAWLVQSCEAVRMHNALAAVWDAHSLDAIDWGWFESMGGEDWLAGLVASAPEDISEAYGFLLVRREGLKCKA